MSGGAATIVVARSATGIGSPLASTRGGRNSRKVARSITAMMRDAGGEPHLFRIE